MLLLLLPFPAQGWLQLRLLPDLTWGQVRSESEALHTLQRSEAEVQGPAGLPCLPGEAGGLSSARRTGRDTASRRRARRLSGDSVLEVTQVAGGGRSHDALSWAPGGRENLRMKSRLATLLSSFSDRPACSAGLPAGTRSAVLPGRFQPNVPPRVPVEHPEEAVAGSGRGRAGGLDGPALPVEVPHLHRQGVSEKDLLLGSSGASKPFVESRKCAAFCCRNHLIWFIFLQFLVQLWLATLAAAVSITFSSPGE